MRDSRGPVRYTCSMFSDHWCSCKYQLFLSPSIFYLEYMKQENVLNAAFLGRCWLRFTSAQCITRAIPRPYDWFYFMSILILASCYNIIHLASLFLDDILSFYPKNLHPPPWWAGKTCYPIFALPTPEVLLENQSNRASHRDLHPLLMLPINTSRSHHGSSDWAQLLLLPESGIVKVRKPSQFVMTYTMALLAVARCKV